MTKTSGNRLDLFDNKFMLPNASHLEMDISDPSQKTPYIIICMDIVSLRTINDGYGRKVGDVFLFAVRDWIQNLNYGRFYHLESDEFCLLLDDTDMGTALKKAQRIFERFKEPWDLRVEKDIRHLFCEVSMGMIPSKNVHYTSDILNVIDRIIRIAAKRDDIVIYDEKTDQQLKRRLEIEISIKSCTKNDMQGFEVYYQPIVSSITGLWCGLEALCRWTSPDLGAVPPNEFIPVAEHQGLIGTIGEWVLENSILQCKKWGLDTHADFFLDVNLSPVQLLDESLDSRVIDILKRLDYPNDKLSLEITESTRLNFNNHTLDAISRLTQHRIPVALDDFGTGYSSFHSLKNLPVSVLKTEKVFLDDIENDEFLQRLLETMVSLAHASGMKMIAEGVENEEQMRMLMNNRVDFAQGYLFSKPLPASKLQNKLNHFYKKDNNSIAGDFSRIDINSLIDSDNTYILPPSLYKTLIRCMHVLFNAADVEEGITSVLAMIGKMLNVNRLALFLKDSGANTFSNAYEWHDADTQSNIERFKNVDIEMATPSFIPLFEKEGMIISPDVSSLPEDLYQMFLAIGVKSNIAIPLWRENNLLGFVGLDICTERRNWLPEEVLLVHSVCGIFANVLDRAYLQAEIMQKDETLKSVLENGCT